MSELALERKTKGIERAQNPPLSQSSKVGKDDLSCCPTSWELKWLKVSGVEGMCSRLKWGEKQHRVEGEEEGSSEYQECL